MQSIPFDDIVLGAIVRFTEIDSKQYLSVRDLIMCLCGKNSNDANKTWSRLPQERKD